MELNQAGREEVALALLLWKDFKRQGKFDADIYIRMLKLADSLGVRKELDELDHKLLVPFEIKLKI